MLIHFSSPHNVPGKPAQGNCMDYEQVIASICDDMQASVFRRTGRVGGLKGGLPEIIWALSLVQRPQEAKQKEEAGSVQHPLLLPLFLPIHSGAEKRSGDQSRKGLGAQKDLPMVPV